MFHLRPHWLLPVAGLAVSAVVHAGHLAPASSKASPLDAQAAVPAATHESAFTGYRGYTDEQLRPWTEANDKVRVIGGWRTYAREASQADAPASAPASADAAPKPGEPAKPMPQGHDGHKMK